MADDPKKKSDPSPPSAAGSTVAGLFVAVGHEGQRLVSENGSEWKNQQYGKEGEVYRCVRFGNGCYVAAGTYGGKNIFAVSRDGASWVTSSKDGQYKNFIRGMGFGLNMFLAVGGDPGTVGSSSPFTASSTDGVAWSDYVSISGKNILRRVAFGNNLFVGVGDRGRRAASPDGKTWTDAPDVKAIDTLVDVAFGNGIFVGVGLHGLRMMSTDGVKWTHRVLGEEGEHLNAIVFAEDRFVAVGMGATYLSPDGVVWKRHENKDAPLTVAYGKKVFLGANWKGRLMLSSDAIEWKQVHKCEHHVEAVAFGA
ncbi:MAG TPA: hypothetical protein VEK08_18545 [Planctomycetota bacterium]|nr:hypothetical protein [Planctomycetota bacterium]